MKLKKDWRTVGEVWLIGIFLLCAVHWVHGCSPAQKQGVAPGD